MPPTKLATTVTAAPNRASRTLPRAIAFSGTSVAFISLYLAAGAPTPLLPLYQHQWNFPQHLITLAFAVYTAGLLVSLLTVGSLSDHIGRKPVLLGALGVQFLSAILFLSAPDIGWVITARIVQGFATGAATSAFAANLVELAPAHHKKLGTIIGSIGMSAGLAFGALLSGFAIEFVPNPNQLIFSVLAALSIIGIAITSFTPETTQRKPGALRSLLPQVAVPLTARKEFAAAAPAVAAAWMLAGLSLGLAPSIVRNVFHLDSGLLNGLTGFVGPAVSAVAGLTLIRLNSRTGMIVGILASIVGAVGILAGVLLGSLGIMIAGQFVGGIGFGAAFTAALRLIMPLTAPHQKGATVAAVYIVAYIGFSVPVILVGQLAAPLGFVPAIVSYGLLTCFLCLIGLITQHSLHSPNRV